MNTMDLLQAIRERKSIRAFKPDPVPLDLLKKIIGDALWAPSWANTQCWRFVVVRDRQLRSKLADTGIDVATGKPNRGTEAMRVTPIAIVVCAEMRKAGYSIKEPKKPVTDKGDWYMYDVALAMQNLTLAAHALGLGTVHIGAFDAIKVAEILGVPEGYAVVSMTPLGYPNEEPNPRPRKELAEIVFYDRFGSGGGGK